MRSWRSRSRAGSRARARFAREHGIGEDELEAAVRKGLGRAAADAESADRLSGTEAALLRAAVERLPIGVLLEAVRSGRGLIDAVGGFFGG